MCDLLFSISIIFLYDDTFKVRASTSFLPAPAFDQHQIFTSTSFWPAPAVADAADLQIQQFTHFHPSLTI